MLFANLLVLATAALGAVINYDGAEYDDGQYDDQFLIGPPVGRLTPIQNNLGLT